MYLNNAAANSSAFVCSADRHMQYLLVRITWRLLDLQKTSTYSLWNKSSSLDEGSLLPPVEAAASLALLNALLLAVIKFVNVCNLHPFDKLSWNCVEDQKPIRVWETDVLTVKLLNICYSRKSSKRSLYLIIVYFFFINLGFILRKTVSPQIQKLRCSYSGHYSLFDSSL